MKCLRCGAEMKQYNFNANLHIYGREYDPGHGRALSQKPHNPQSIFECSECGYMELSSKICENEDI